MSRAMTPAVAAAGRCSRLSFGSSARSVSALKTPLREQCRMFSSAQVLLLRGKAVRSSGLSRASSVGVAALLRVFEAGRLLPAVVCSFSGRRHFAVSAVTEDEEESLRSLKDNLKSKDGEVDELNKALKDQAKRTKSLKKENMKMTKEMDGGKGSKGQAKGGSMSARGVTSIDDESDLDLSEDSDLSELEKDEDESDVTEDSDSEFEKEFGKLEESDSEFDASVENGKEVSDLSDVEDVLAQKGKLSGAKEQLDTSVGGEAMDAWKRFATLLKQKHYFRLDADHLVKGEAAYENYGNISHALVRFGTERDDILKLLPVDDLKVLAGYPCPSIRRKTVNSGKRLRGHCEIEEGDVCQRCNEKDDCSRAYLPPDSTASTKDVLQYVFAYMIETSDGTDFPDNVKKSLKNTLNQLTSLGSVPRDPSAPHEDKEVFKRSKRLRPQAEEFEMKPGDWKCVECEYVNFCRNRHCRECHTPRPPQQLRPGDWECSECRFVNFSRNEECHDCKAERPSSVKVFHSVKGTKEKWEGSVGEYAKVADRLDRKAKFSDGLDDSEDEFKSKTSARNAVKSPSAPAKRKQEAESDSDLASDFDEEDFDIKPKKSLGKKQSVKDAWDDDSDEDEKFDFRPSRPSRGGAAVRGGRGRGTFARSNEGEIGSPRGRGFATGARGGRASFADKDSDDDFDDESSEDDFGSSRGGRGGSFTRGRGRGGRGAAALSDSEDDLDASEDDFPSRGARGGRGGSRGSVLPRGGRGRFADDSESDDFSGSEDDDPRSSRGGRGGGLTRGRGRGGRGSFGDFGDSEPRGGRGGAPARGSRFGKAKFESDDASDLDSDDFMSDSEDDDKFRGSRGRGGGGGGRGRYGGDDFSGESDDEGDFSRGSRGRGRGRFNDFGGGRGGGGRFGGRGGGFGGRGGYGDRDSGDRFGDRDSFRGGRGGGRFGDRGGGFRGGFGGRGGYGDRDRFGDRDNFRGDRDDFRGGRGGRGGFGDRDRDDDFRGGRGGRGSFGDRDDDFRGGRGGRGGFGDRDDDFRGGRGGRGGFGDRDDFRGRGRGGGGFRGGFNRGGFRSRDF